MTDQDGSMTPIGPCDLARSLQDALRSLEQVLRSLSRGAQLPPDAAIEIGDVRRFIACAHEEARQLVDLMTASAHAARWATWREDLREAVPSAASQQAAHAGAPPAQLGAVLDAFGPLKIAASALAFAMVGRAPRAALLHLEWIERWLFLSSASMARAVAFIDASASGDSPAAAEDRAEPRDPEPATGDRHGTPPRQPRRARSTPGSRLL